MNDPGIAAQQAFASYLAEEAQRLLADAAARRILLRLSGSIAVALHSEHRSYLLNQLGRRPFHDIDMIGYSRQRRAIAQLLEDHSYVMDPIIKQAQEYGVKRLIYVQPERHVRIDVFLDELAMAHTIRFNGRLELDSPTISLTDLLLSKLQIHDITENDLKDTMVLFAEHDIGQDSRETIDGAHIVSLLSREWGFCHTVVANLDKLEGALDQYPSLPTELTELVRSRLNQLKEQINAVPKNWRWRLRAKLGTRIAWYEDVEDVHR